MRNVILLGPPGAGKGTAGEFLSEKYGIVHISTGALLRDQIAQETELGITAKILMDKGELVPNHLVISMVKERLNDSDTEVGYMLDGFPRTREQALALAEVVDRIGRHLTHVIYLNTARDTIMKRLSGRRVGPISGRIYNIYNTLLMPKVEGICDVSGEKLIQRDDDKEETVANRMEVYNNQTKELINFYREKNLLTEFSGNEDVDSTNTKLSDLLD
ncbi:MAG: adenylate kinase [Candidatus Omnitrophota bacterium]|jgi:adenylate kinase